MSRFAHECLTRMNKLTKQLEVVLGPSTGDLRARVGLHSGQVTAGVLRGEKARFQLFGDTMNTAARMESSGVPNRIHISQATHDLLVAAKKEHWVKIRKDLVVIKGKGELQTYWALPSRKSSDTASSSGYSDSNSGDIDAIRLTKDPEMAKEFKAIERAEKKKRLVDWNVEVIYSLIEQLAAKRQKEVKSLTPALEQAEKKLLKNRPGIVLEEMTEVLEVPAFDPTAVNAITAKIDPRVKEELRDFVARISNMYDPAVPFHNFEHAR